jgi:hypothetical protein
VPWALSGAAVVTWTAEDKPNGSNVGSNPEHPGSIPVCGAARWARAGKNSNFPTSTQLLKGYTVRLLSFRTGIIKSICVKEMTLLFFFSFRHTSLLTAHTDSHGHTAYGCLCRSRPLQRCLMNLLRLSGCPKIKSKGRPFKWDLTFGGNKS